MFIAKNKILENVVIRGCGGIGQRAREQNTAHGGKITIYCYGIRKDVKRHLFFFVLSTGCKRGGFWYLIHSRVSCFAEQVGAI